MVLRDWSGRYAALMSPGCDHLEDDGARSLPRFRQRRWAPVAAGALFVSSALAGFVWIGVSRLRPRQARGYSFVRGAKALRLVADDKHQFELVAHGNCAALGLEPIDDLQTCQEAANELQLADVTAMQTDFPGIPEGCYYFEDTEMGLQTLWLGTRPENVGNGAQSAPGGKTRMPICRRPRPSTEATTSSSTSTSEPAGVHENGWQLGDVARVRDSTDEDWEVGEVVSVDPLMVKPHGWRKAFPWQIVEHMSDDSAAVGRMFGGGAAPSAGGRPQPTLQTTAAPTQAPPQQPVKHVLKGVCYAPVPDKHPKRLDNDDFMSANTRPLWHREGRGDLRVIRSMGANTIRLYGNDPNLDHRDFLDEAYRHSLGVIVGFSDYPFIQMAGNCASTDFNCYKQVKEQYQLNLQGGFLTTGASGKVNYHPALRTVILMNEPDLKMRPFTEPRNFVKSLVSALDAVLDAEREAGIDPSGGLPLPNLTATFSFAVCRACAQFSDKPALAQMWELRQAMMNPKSVGYEAKNDLWEAYRTRFVNSFNTANPAEDLRPLFLDAYHVHFQGTPVFIGEYHSPNVVSSQRDDLRAALSIAEDESTLLQGLSFFEFQVRYDKGGSEMAFGMFGLGDTIIDTIKIQNTEFKVRCLEPMEPPVEQMGTPSDRTCGLMEPGVAYTVAADEWTHSSAGVKDPDECCSMCQRTPRCRAWTWHEDIDGTTCRMKGARPAGNEGRVPTVGCVSGEPPARELDFREDILPSVTAEDRKSLVPQAVAEAFGGTGIQYGKLCDASALTLFMFA